MYKRQPFYQVGDGAQALILAVMLLADGALMIAPRQAAFRTLKPHVQNWLMLLMVFVSGLCFSLWLWMGQAPTVAPSAVFLATVPELAVALLAVCIFGDRRLLGIGYFLGLLLVAVLENSSVTQVGLLICCVIVMAIATVRQARVDREHAIERHRQDLRAQRSDRLLLEHERTGRGWFWETDRHGCLTYISDTLAQTLDAREGALIGRPMTEIIRPSDKQQGDGERTLGFHLSARTGFSDLSVCAAMAPVSYTHLTLPTICSV